MPIRYWIKNKPFRRMFAAVLRARLRQATGSEPKAVRTGPARSREAPADPRRTIVAGQAPRGVRGAAVRPSLPAVRERYERFRGSANATSVSPRDDSNFACPPAAMTTY